MRKVNCQSGGPKLLSPLKFMRCQRRGPKPIKTCVKNDYYAINGPQVLDPLES